MSLDTAATRRRVEGGPNAHIVRQLCDEIDALRAFRGRDQLSDDALWDEVQRRQLVTVVGWVNPEHVTEHDFVKGHVLWTRTWVNRWPVYGLRGGDSIHAQLRAHEDP